MMGEERRSSQLTNRRGVLRALAGSLLGFLVGARPGGGVRADAAGHAGRTLSVIPRRPRPATLSPALFQGKTARAYRIAKEVPELVEQMPCYCGCFKSHRHQSNLDCYVDRHAFG